MNIVKTKQQVQIEQQVLYLLAQIIEICPQYTLSQHFSHFLRRKGEAKDVYFWSDQQVLNKVEAYYDELKNDLLSNKSDEEY